MDSFLGEIDYKRYKEKYKEQNQNCKDIRSILVNSETKEILKCKCNNYSCQPCRYHKKFILFIEVLKAIYSFNLQRHFVITYPGRNYREHFTWNQSYDFMSQIWDKYKLKIEYDYGSINYILFSRAQNDGYCHYHILINKYIPWKYLDETRKKYKLGFVSIQKNKDVGEYLTVDYWKDDEWIIPPNIKHYRSSRCINLNNIESDPIWCFFDRPLETIEDLNDFKKIYGFVPDVKLKTEKELKISNTNYVLNILKNIQEKEKKYGDLKRFETYKDFIRRKYPILVKEGVL